MLINGQIKSVIISGKIKDLENKLLLKLLPNEFATGTWSLCLQSLAYSMPTELNAIRNIYSLHCNLVTSDKFSRDGTRIENYEQPLSIFILDGKVKKKSFAFDKTWFYLNVFSDKLVITVNNLENIVINPEFEVFLVVLFQKIK